MPQHQNLQALLSGGGKNSKKTGYFSYPLTELVYTRPIVLARTGKSLVLCNRIAVAEQSQ
jgi:hypothetical protein